MYRVADVSNMDGRPLGLFRRSLRDFSSSPTSRGSSTDSGLRTSLLPRPLLATTDQGEMYAKVN